MTPTMMRRPDRGTRASIQAQDLSFGYGSHAVLKGVSLSATGRRTIGIVGPNGSGKTTLLNLLNGSLRPGSGSIHIDGTPLAGLASKQVALRIATVAQVDDVAVPFDVAHTVLQGRLPHLGMFARFSAVDREVAADALARAGAGDLAGRPWQALSGGEQRRVLIARALAQDTPILLLDEPTNHLDLHHQHQVLGLVASLDALVLVVLHDLNLAARYCDRILLLDQGRVVADGPPAAVLDPAILEPVYRIQVHPQSLSGVPQLLFAPPGAP